MGDIADIARGTALAMMGRPSEHLEPYRPAGVRAHKGGYYVRLSVFDRPGALAAIASRMAEKGISLESIVQRRRAPHAAVVGTQAPAEPQSIIMITYETTEAAVREALDLIRDDGHVADAPQFIRIEAL